MKQPDTPTKTRPRLRPGPVMRLAEDEEKKLLTALRVGHYLETAANFAGLSIERVRRMILRGRRYQNGQSQSPTDKKFAELVGRIEKAMADSEVTHLQKIDAAASSGVWQAAAWMLERRHPARWRQRTSTEVEGHIQVSVADEARAKLKSAFGDEDEPDEDEEADDDSTDTEPAPAA